MAKQLNGNMRLVALLVPFGVVVAAMAISYATSNAKIGQNAKEIGSLQSSWTAFSEKFHKQAIIIDRIAIKLDVSTKVDSD